MKFVADLHIHSRFSRATSKSLDLSSLHLSALQKGITLLGTGDFTHPAWRAELEEQLVPAEPGLYSLRPDLRKKSELGLPKQCHGETRFVLQVEISTIYKYAGKTRKVHHVILSPSLESASQLSAALGSIGNVTSDGRPILGLDSRDLLEMVLEHCPGGVLIPAHIWTPWFSVLGSKSGFETIAECYRDLVEHIFAVETGLSSDPPMNWRVSDLDKYALVSNSDAHSPSKLARECNLFDTELSFDGVINALKEKDSRRFLGTIEFFPEEGKYHLDGHRKCGCRLTPDETKAADGRCPACGRPLTVGVMHRVEDLADRPIGSQPPVAFPFHSLISLAETIGHVRQRGPATKGVSLQVQRLLDELGPELVILQDSSIADIEKIAGDIVAEAIRRIRAGEVRWDAGYDGEYGRFEILSPKEREILSGQIGLAGFDPGPQRSSEDIEEPPLPDQIPPKSRPAPPIQPALDTGFSETSPRKATVFDSPSLNNGQDKTSEYSWLLENLGEEQRIAVEAAADHPLLVIAGPGTGKTRTLTTRIAYRTLTGALDPAYSLALTFTNKAAAEMAERLESLVGDEIAALSVMTFHAWGLTLLRSCGRSRTRILGEKEQLELVKRACQEVDVEGGRRAARIAAELISLDKSGAPFDMRAPFEQSSFELVRDRYEALLKEEDADDFDGLVTRAIEAIESDAEGLPPRPRAVFVDEYQDLNPSQVRLLEVALRGQVAELFVIGDPDQAIYGFRGADPMRILEFEKDWPGAKTLTLGRSYRSCDTILEAATQVISRAPGKDRPRLWSGIDGEPHCLIISASDERTEAERVALLIEQLLGGTGFLTFDSELITGSDDREGRNLELTLGDIAVLYRLRSQGEALSNALGKLGLPVQMVRKASLDLDPEVASTIAALRLLAGRGSSADHQLAKTEGWSDSLPELRHQLANADAVTTLRTITDHTLELEERVRVRRSLENAAARVDRVFATKALKKVSFVKAGRPLDDLIDWLALHGEVDQLRPGVEQISHMTLHAAKGLEWRVVVVAGCEEGIVPHRRPNRVSDIDEERRLFFVGMTRAERLLILSHAKERTLYGRKTSQKPSPFLLEIEERYKKAALTGSKTKTHPEKRRNQLELF